MTDLRIAKGFALPADAVTETFAILAKRGAGKTYTTLVMAEEMVRAGLPVCIVDPVGVAWGLRSSADGQIEGLIAGYSPKSGGVRNAAGELRSATGGAA